MNIDETKIPPILRSQLKHIRKCLSDGQAAAMIGAGFSKNADMDKSVTMKDWQKLGESFYAKIYDCEPDKTDLRIANPIRLATQVEAIYNRSVLDEVIKASLPDNRISPSELHKKLLALNWSDVFTTNYDTLLERAADDTSRFYHKVTNVKSLLYEKKPRIIKLHGSFPDDTPFIITEEDYRTYPQTHKAFINTVRQSLIENVFCLIGFSSEDPNFLQWIGWLRDLWGEEMTPAFWITYIEKEKVNLADIKLLEKRGISTINLNDISGIDNFYDALSFFLDYIGENEKNKEWDNEEFENNSLIEYKFDKPEQIKATITKMKGIRESYPGWLVIPHTELYYIMKDVTEEFPNLNNDKSIDKLDDKTKLLFLYELDWRLSVSLTPKIIDWYIDSLEQISDYEYSDKEDLFRKECLSLSLLSIYRITDNDQKFLTLYNKLTEQPNKLCQDHLSKVYYEGGLFAITRFDIALLTKILESWNPSISDYQGNIWKALLYLENGEDNSALKLVQATGTYLRKAYLSTQGNSPLINSCLSALSNLERWSQGQFTGQTSITEPTTYSIYQTIKNFEFEYFKNKDNADSYREIHRFGINKTFLQWRSGNRGFYKSYLNAFRIATSKENFGYPWGLPWVNLDSSWLNIVCSTLGDEHPGYILDILIRSYDKNLLETIVSRNLISKLKRAQANQLFDKYIKLFDDKNNGLIQTKKTVLTAIILIRLCIKIDQDKIILLFEKILELIDKKIFIDDRHIQVIYDCVDFEHRENVLSLIEKYNHLNLVKPKYFKKGNQTKKYSIDLDLLDKFKYQNYKYNNSSVSIDKFKKDLEKISYFANDLEFNAKYKLISEINEYLSENEEYFKGNERSSFFGGMSFSLDPLFDIINTIMYKLTSNIQLYYNFDDIVNTLSRYHSYGYYTLSSQAFLVAASKENSVSLKNLKEDISKSIASADRYMSADALDAVYILKSSRISVQLIIKKVIDYAEFTLNTNCTNHIRFIKRLVENNILDGDPYRSINSFLINMFERVHELEDEDLKADIQFEMLKLAGTLSYQSFVGYGISVWEEFSQDDETHNDVKLGFMEARVNMSNKS